MPGVSEILERARKKQRLEENDARMARALDAEEQRAAAARADAISNADMAGRDVLLKVRASIPLFLEERASGLNVTKVSPNAHAEVGQPLYERFLTAWVETNMKIELCFHGTPSANIEAICREGLDPRRRSGQALGRGEYFGVHASTSLGYCRGGTRMIVFAVLSDPSGITARKCGAVVVHKVEHQLPLCVLDFTSKRRGGASTSTGTCQAVLKSGARKGQQCGKRARGTCCALHGGSKQRTAHWTPGQLAQK